MLAQTIVKVAGNIVATLNRAGAARSLSVWWREYKRAGVVTCCALISSLPVGEKRKIYLCCLPVILYPVWWRHRAAGGIMLVAARDAPALAARGKTRRGGGRRVAWHGRALAETGVNARKRYQHRNR